VGAFFFFFVNRQIASAVNGPAKATFLEPFLYWYMGLATSIRNYKNVSVVDIRVAFGNLNAASYFPQFVVNIWLDRTTWKISRPVSPS
jgi:hypothetical protein